APAAPRPDPAGAVRPAGRSVPRATPFTTPRHRARSLVPMTHDVPRGADRSGAHPARLRPARPSRRRAGPDHDPTAPRTREGAAAETRPRAPGPVEPGTPAPGSAAVTGAIERRAAPENVPAVTRTARARAHFPNRYRGV